MGFSSREAQALERRLSCLRHVRSSQTRIKPVSPALAGGFLTTGAPGKSLLKMLVVKFDNRCDTLQAVRGIESGSAGPSA